MSGSGLYRIPIGIASLYDLVLLGVFHTVSNPPRPLGLDNIMKRKENGSPLLRESKDSAIEVKTVLRGSARRGVICIAVRRVIRPLRLYTLLYIVF